MSTKAEAFGSAGSAPTWYHGKMGRREAEDKLRATPDGTFLIRDSTSSDGDFVLSASEAGRVSHYIVQRKGSHSYHIGDQEFYDLVQVLEFYKTHLLDTSVLTTPLPLGAKLDGGRLQANSLVTVRALYNFNARDPEDLSFRKGDILNVLEKHEAQWWRAQSHKTLQIGCIPVNYVEDINKPAPAPAVPQPRGKPLQRSESVMEPQRELAPRARAALPTPPPAAAPSRASRAPLPTPPVIDGAASAFAAATAAQNAQNAANAAAGGGEGGAGSTGKLKAALPFGLDEPPPDERPKFIVARAILDRVANAYDGTALSFKESDIIQVTRQNENGLWDGCVFTDGDNQGKTGHFPFTLVELLVSAEYDEDLKQLEQSFEQQMDEIYGTI